MPRGLRALSTAACRRHVRSQNQAGQVEVELDQATGHVAQEHSSMLYGKRGHNAQHDTRL